VISFLFYLPATRQDTFAQQLRILQTREDLSECEAVVVWHGPPGQVNLFQFKSHIIHSINLEKYNKNILVNKAVSLANNEILAILDADRILPKNYFKNYAQNLKPKTAIVPEKMIKLTKNFSDERILNNRFTYKRDDRVKQLIPFKKHAFSGNTILFKKDYLESGGMDESYWGYGFNDLDFSKTWESKGFYIEWNQKEEIHLFHEHPKDLTPEEFHIQNAMNAFKFSKKWNLPLSNLFNKEIAAKSISIL